MPKLTTKLAPATKAMKQSEPLQAELQDAHHETTGLAGMPDLEDAEANEIRDSDSIRLSETQMLIPESVEAACLAEDMTEQQLQVRQSGKSGKSTKSKPKAPAVNVDPYDGFTVVISQAMALKLNPKTQNHIFFDVAVKQADKNLYLRMSGNEGGGLHSKEWLPVEPILNLIEKYQGQSFKSTVFNSLFRGSSANNAGFLGAVLRSPALGLLKASDVAVFQHQLPADYESKKAALTALNAV